MMQIYLARNNQQAGPYTLEQLNQMLADGQVKLNDLAWHQDMLEWKPLGDLTQGQMSYRPVQSSTTSLPIVNNPTGNAAPSNTTSNATPQKTANLQKQADIFDKTSSEARSVPVSALSISSVNKRVLAKIIDILLLWIPSSFIFSQFINPDFAQRYQEIAAKSIIPTQQQQQQLLDLMGTLPNGLYWTLGLYVLFYFALQGFLIFKSGQSIGKKILKIKIVDDQTGQIAPLTRSFLLRSILFVVINYFAIFFILIDFGFLFSERHRTLHDRLAKTLVVDAK